MTSRSNGNTVFLTAKEAERIKNTARHRLKECSDRKGQAWEPKNAKTAVFNANGAALMADMGCMGPNKRQGDTMAALVVGQVYPPSIVSLEDLQPMTLADLRIGSHHRGFRLAVRRVSLVVSLAARSWTVVEDAAEDISGEGAGHLEVCLHKFRHGKDVLESASLLIIKEPYFTLNDQDEPTVRIDHPSDLIVADGETGSNQPNQILESPEKLAKKAKAEGNVALKKKNLSMAYAKYTTALDIAKQAAMPDSNSDIVRDIHRNRALANLLMHRFDEAKADSIASLANKCDQYSRELDSKAYSRAASATYNLGEYEKAKAFFDNQLDLAPGDKAAAVNLKRVSERLHEKETGVYNLKRIRARLARDRLHADAATFISQMELRDSPGRGRGLFATRDFSAGEIIMCEKAFCVVSGHGDEALSAMTYDVRDERIRASPVGLTRSIVQKLLNNPSQIERVMDLYGHYQGDGKDVVATQDGPVVDAFRVHDIMSRNAFSLGDEGAGNMSTGLWIWAAYINHSCVPNTTKELYGDLLLLRASRPIVAGEELFISYYSSCDYDERKESLMTTWGFECNCILCVAEQADGVAVRNARAKLAQEASLFVQRHHSANATRFIVAKAQRFSTSIEATYDVRRYDGVPRLAMGQIEEWLARAKLCSRS